MQFSLEATLAEGTFVEAHVRAGVWDMISTESRRSFCMTGNTPNKFPVVGGIKCKKEYTKHDPIMTRLLAGLLLYPTKF